MRAFAIADLRRLEFFVVLSVVLFVAGAALLSVVGGEGAVLRRIAAVPASTMAAMLGLALLNYSMRAARWLIYSDELGIAVGAGRAILYFIAGFALGTTPGKVGEALRLWLLERGHGYRYVRVTPLFLGDRLSDMNGVLLLCLFGVASFPGQLWIAVLAAIAVVVLTLGFVIPGPLIGLVGALYGLMGRRGRKPFAKLRLTLRHTTRLFAARTYAVTLLLSVIGWCAEAVAFYLLLRALGAPASFAEASFIFGFALIVGAVSLLPGGLGGTEATMLALLSAIGVDFETALVATAVIRAATLWFGVALGFAALPVALRLVRRAPRAASAGAGR